MREKGSRRSHRGGTVSRGLHIRVLVTLQIGVKILLTVLRDLSHHVDGKGVVGPQN
jgi:hypothetical protein